MKARITLDGGAGELDFRIVDDADNEEAIATALIEMVEACGTMSVGDTITIREVA